MGYVCDDLSVVQSGSVTTLPFGESLERRYVGNGQIYYCSQRILLSNPIYDAVLRKVRSYMRSKYHLTLVPRNVAQTHTVQIHCILVIDPDSKSNSPIFQM